jgi:hypothetical protein
MKELPPEEWAFGGLPIDEAIICMAYELAREVVIQDIEQQKSLQSSEISKTIWLEDLVLELRGDANLKDFDRGLAYGLHAFVPLMFSTPLLYPKWPQEAYLNLDAVERQRRAKKLQLPELRDKDHAYFLTTMRAGDFHVTLSILNALVTKTY